MLNPLNQYQQPESQRPQGQNLIPIETVFNLDPVPGSSLQIGHGAKVFEVSGELFTINQRKGALLGCGHYIYDSREIGGRCRFCQQEAIIILNQNQIPEEQADSHSLYCIACFSHCQACLTNLCLRHSTIIQEDTAMVLCPSCLEALKRQKRINLLLKILLFPFVFVFFLIKLSLLILIRIFT